VLGEIRFEQYMCHLGCVMYIFMFITVIVSLYVYLLGVKILYLIDWMDLF